MSIFNPGAAAIPASGEASIPAGPTNPGPSAIPNPGDASIPAGPTIPDPGTASIFAGPAGPDSPKHWYSRGYLPHLDQPGLLQSINFRLHDAVPAHVIEQWKHELRWREGTTAHDPSAIALRRRMVEYQDAGHGACWLHDERIAALVENALLHFDNQRYRLIAWCVMPNHVHVLIETWPGYPLDKVLHSWKSFTAQQANKLLERTGPFWAREYYDRFIRDDRHFEQAVAYIEQNPVKAGLVASAEDWPFGSAARREVGQVSNVG